MAWFKVDDRLWSHPKWMMLPIEAKALWVSAGSYCAMHETDGEISCQTLAIVLPNSRQTRAANALVEAGLWERTKDGYKFHNWNEYQPTRADIVAKREREKERKRRYRKGSKGRYTTAGGTGSEDVPELSRRDTLGTDAGTTGGTTGGSPSSPTRPDPTIYIPPIVPLPGDGVPEPATGAALAVVHDTTTDSNDGEDYPTWEKLPTRGKSRHYPADFLEWHQAYPHEREAHDKKAQYRAWRAATRRDTVANILDGTRRYAADPNRVPTYTPAAARWLRKDGWRESALPSRTTTPYTRSQQAAAADFARLQQAKQDQHNQDTLQIGGTP